ncbi:MAG: hypothetical protein ACJ71D_02670 [Nitrososphaera sp.]
MVEIHSFLNFATFFGTFLPGYVAMSLYLALFQPQLLFDKGQSLSADLFAAIVFIVAGPTIGAVLSQVHGQFLSVVFQLYYWLKSGWLYQFKGIRTYSSVVPFGAYYVRSKSSESEREAQDNGGALYTFCISTFLAVIVITTYHLASGAVFDNGVHLLLYILAFILLANGVYMAEFDMKPFSMYLSKKYDPIFRKQRERTKIKEKDEQKERTKMNLKDEHKRAVEEASEAYFNEELNDSNNELETILRTRLAKGELTIAQYEELRESLDLS